MTKTEAITRLSMIFANCDTEMCKGAYVCKYCDEAISMAIKELEQETVSREAYDQEFNLRKKFEMKAFELENKIAEQAQIIYCEECKHWKEWENAVGACHRSENSCFWFGTDADDYCSYAERMESDEE